ncbi:hypothetical protein HGB13_02055 [bacterium]|nr:hypothetical protein [bacterium]
MFIPKSQDALAASSNVQWTTDAHFNNNGPLKANYSGATTKSKTSFIGTVSTTNGNATVSGNGTNWNTTLKQFTSWPATVYISGTAYTVSSSANVTDDTHVTVSPAPSSSASGLTMSYDSSQTISDTVKLSNIQTIRYGLNGDSGKTAATNYSLLIPSSATAVYFDIKGAGGGGDYLSGTPGNLGGTTSVTIGGNSATANSGSGSEVNGQGNIVGFTGLSKQDPDSGGNNGGGGENGWSCGCEAGDISDNIDGEDVCWEQPGYYDYYPACGGSVAPSGGSGGYVYGSAAIAQVSGQTLAINIGAGGTGANSGQIGSVVISYSVAATISNYRIDSTFGAKSKWNTISWDANVPTETTQNSNSNPVKFRTRGSNIDNPVTMTGNADTGWTYWNNNAGGTVYNTVSGSPIVINGGNNSSRWLEIEVTLSTGNVLFTPTLNDFSVSSNSLDTPTSLKAWDGSTDISVTGWTNIMNPTLKVNVPAMGTVASGGIPTETLTPQLELVSPSSASFTNPTNTTDVKPVGVIYTRQNVSYVENTAQNNITIGTLSGLSNTSYKWQIRFYDSAGRVSAWSAPNIFDVEQALPTVTSFVAKSSTGSSTYVNTNTRVLTTSGTINDTGGSSTGASSLKIQFSQDGTNWGVYSGAGTTNNKTTDWTNFKTVTPGSSPQDIAGSWYLEGSDASGIYLYTRVKDNAGNISVVSSTTTYTSNIVYTVPSGVTSVGLDIYGAGGGSGEGCGIPCGTSYGGGANGGSTTLTYQGTNYIAYGGGGGSDASDYNDGSSGSEGGTSIHSGWTSIPGGGATGGGWASGAEGSGGPGGAGGKLSGTLSGLSAGQTLNIVIGQGGSGQNTGSNGSVALSLSSPFVPSTNTLILDTANPVVPNSTITSPNGSEAWKGGTSHTITWNSAGINDGTGSGLRTSTPPIKLEYSTDDTNWTLVSDNEANDGAYIWNPIPSLNSTTIKVKITATDNVGLSTSDVSNNNFTIDSTAPNGSVSNLNALQNTKTISIPYVASDTLSIITGYEQIFIGCYGDPAYNLEECGADAEYVDGDPIYSSVTLSGVDYTNLYYKKDAGSWTKYNGNFDFISSPGTITFDSTALGDGNYTFKLVSVDNAGNFSEIPTGTNTYVDSKSTIIDSTAPNTSSVSGISSNPNNTGNQGITWSVFLDNAPSSGFQKYVIQRKPGVAESYVDIQTETNVNTLTYADNSNLTEGSYYYRVVSYDNAGNYTNGPDSAELKVDRTAPSLAYNTVTSPNGSESFSGGSTRNITWDTTRINDAFSGLKGTNGDTSVTLSYSADNQSSWNDIATNLNNGNNGCVNPTSGCYPWAIPNIPDSNTVWMRITATDNATNQEYTLGHFDTSNAPFTIEEDIYAPEFPTPVLSVDPLYSNSGTNYTNGNPTISWTAPTDRGSGIINVQLWARKGTDPFTLLQDNINVATLSYTNTFTEGNWEWKVKAIDGVNFETFSPTYQMTVDSTSPTGTLSISPLFQNGITATKIKDVLLTTNSITDTSSGYFETAFSNDGVSWTAFQGASDFSSWDLSDILYGGTSSKGTKTVYIKLKDHVGNVSSNITSTIVWDDATPNHPATISFSSTSNQPSIYSSNVWNGNSSSRISWTASVDPSNPTASGVYRYTVYRALDSNNPNDAITLGTTTNTYWDDSNLLDGHIYTYFIQVTDNALNLSDYTASVPGALTLADVTSPEPPINFSASGVADTTIRLSFNSALDNSTTHSGKADHYSVLRTNALGATEPQNVATSYSYVIPTADISFEGSPYFKGSDLYEIDDTVAAQQWYYYQITAYDQLNQSSTTLYYKARGNFAPIFNQGDISVSVNNGHDQNTAQPGDTVTVTFKTTDQDGRSDLDTGNASQKVKITNGESTEVLAYTSVNTKSNLTDNSLDGYTYTYDYILPSDSHYGTYQVSINVKDSVATGAPGDNTHNQLKTINFKVPPTTPSNLLATGYTSTSNQLAWTAPANLGLRATNTYEIQRKLSTADDSTYTSAGSGFTASTSFTDTGLSMSTTYIYRVRAIDVSSNTGAWSTSQEVTTPKPSVPASAQVKDASNTNLNIGGTYPIRFLVSWDQVSSSNTPDFKGYQVFRSTDGVWDPTPVSTIDCNSLGYNQTYYLDVHTISDQSKIYEYRVATLDSSNNTGDTVQTQSTVQTVAPQLVTQPTATETGVNWIKLRWDSTQPTNAIIKYKKVSESTFTDGDADFTPATDVDNNGSYTNEVIIRGLEKGTDYQFKIQSINQTNLMSPESNEITASTKSFDISSISKATTATGAILSWSTGDITSEGYVEYKKGNDSAKVMGTGANSKSHSVSLSSLEPGDYVFTLKNIDSEGNITTSNLESFTITGFDSGALSSPQAGQIEEKDITATSAKITWSSTIPTTSWVEYGTSSGVYTNQAGNNAFSLDHIVTLEALVPGTTYYYIIKGTDNNDVEYKSKESSFTAQSKPGISSVTVTNITAYTAQVTITATKEVEASFTYGKDSKFDLKAGGGTLAKQHSFTIENLEDNSTYSYYVDIKDTQGNTVKSDTNTFKTPLDANPPKITDVKLSPLSGSDSSKRGIIITWTTDKESSSQVAYSSGITQGSYNQKSPEDPSMTLSHTVVINSLDPGTTYHFQLLSKDKRGNLGESPDYTMLTQGYHVCL